VDFLALGLDWSLLLAIGFQLDLLIAVTDTSNRLPSGSIARCSA
jgi:hypothetical protein